jgi:Fungal protein of unknown function (DUF1770).
MEGFGRKSSRAEQSSRSSSTVNTSSLTHQHVTSTSTMADHTLDIPELLQSASIKRHPSPSHDINPSTAASEKQPVVAAPVSDAASIASDIVDPSRVIRPVRRRQTLPPLPDLRFEQSYLASIRDADTWGRVTWITIRDQVRQPPIGGI